MIEYFRNKGKKKETPRKTNNNTFKRKENTKKNK